ncbi:hypothetical protein [Dysgonomonas sp. Marseille-Q5470]|uniref:hypothetical protein n=1 Tax=Dysgonomonas sp. Marseille-Q5470 TaxID=3039494 RepID=UPI0024BC4DDF|nr:hypothetical protein [Dysgonomonas sp. Marseille-Q5470]
MKTITFARLAYQFIEDNHLLDKFKKAHPDFDGKLDPLTFEEKIKDIESDFIQRIISAIPDTFIINVKEEENSQAISLEKISSL